MIRVLVTGASGFVGSGTLSPLVAGGLEVHGITSREPPEEASAAVEWHVVDLLAPGAEHTVAAIEATHLLHLAWYTEPGRYWSSVENLRWVEASLRLLQAFADAGGQRVVVAGTCAEYEWAAETHCVERVTPTRPATLYGTAKLALQSVGSAFATQAGLSMAWGRIFFAFGPHEHPARLASSVARALIAGEEAPCSPGDQVRDFLYAPELADAFVALLRSEVTGPVNMASGQALPLRDLIQAIADAAGRPELVRLGARPYQRDEPARLTADVSRLRDEVGWRPSLTLAEAAEQTVAWWREHS